MEMRLIFAIILIWGVCSCFAISPHFAPHEALSKISLGTTPGNCSESLSCVDKGDDCSHDWTRNPGLCYLNKTLDCCAFGLYCSGGECIDNNVGDNCTQDSDCYYQLLEYAVCHNKTCVYYSSLGDGCDSQSYCPPPLNCSSNGICSGAAEGQDCSTLPCNFGLYCNISITNSTCVPQVASGGNCSTTAPCMPGTFCNSTGTSNGICTDLFSVPQNGSCTSSDQCEEDNYCASNGKCSPVSTSMPSCSSNSDCTNGAQCTCSPFTGESFCLGALNYNPCTEEEEDLNSCMVENQCSSASANPSSCVYTNCYSDLKDLESCGCDPADTIFSSCFYNQFCGGFPVWAIIVIIIAAIVLVLAIVLLVFFMMRRRRVYDSI